MRRRLLDGPDRMSNVFVLWSNQSHGGGGIYKLICLVNMPKKMKDDDCAKGLDPTHPTVGRIHPQREKKRKEKVGDTNDGLFDAMHLAGGS